MSATRAQLEALAQKIRALTPPERLRLAAELLEVRKPEMALTIARQVVEELGAALVLAGREGGAG